MANTFRKVYKKSYTPGGNPTYELVRTVGVNNVELDLMKGCTHINDGELGLVPKPVAGKEHAYLRGDGEWAEPNIPTYTTMTGCASNKDGVRGLVPQPMQGQQNLFLAGDGNFKKPSLGIKTNSETGVKTLAMNVGSETLSEVNILSAISNVSSQSSGLLDSNSFQNFNTSSSAVFNLPKTIAYIISEPFTTQQYTGYNGATETFTFTVKTPAMEDGTEPLRKFYIRNGDNLVGGHVLYPLLSVQCTEGVDVTKLKPTKMETTYYANYDEKGWYYEHKITFTAGIINHKTENSAGKFTLICQMLLVENYAYDSDDNDIYTYPRDNAFVSTYKEMAPIVL